MGRARSRFNARSPHPYQGSSNSLSRVSAYLEEKYNRRLAKTVVGDLKAELQGGRSKRDVLQAIKRLAERYSGEVVENCNRAVKSKGVPKPGKILASISRSTSRVEEAVQKGDLLGAADSLFKAYSVRLLSEEFNRNAGLVKGLLESAGNVSGLVYLSQFYEYGELEKLGVQLELSLPDVLVGLVAEGKIIEPDYVELYIGDDFIALKSPPNRVIVAETPSKAKQEGTPLVLKGSVEGMFTSLLVDELVDKRKLTIKPDAVRGFITSLSSGLIIPYTITNDRLLARAVGLASNPRRAKKYTVMEVDKEALRVLGYLADEEYVFVNPPGRILVDSYPALRVELAGRRLSERYESTGLPVHLRHEDSTVIRSIQRRIWPLLERVELISALDAGVWVSGFKLDGRNSRVVVASINDESLLEAERDVRSRETVKGVLLRIGRRDELARFISSTHPGNVISSNIVLVNGSNLAVVFDEYETPSERLVEDLLGAIGTVGHRRSTVKRIGVYLDASLSALKGAEAYTIPNVLLAETYSRLASLGYLLVTPLEGKTQVKDQVLRLLEEVENASPKAELTITMKTLRDPNEKLSVAFNLNVTALPARGILYEIPGGYALEVPVKNNGPRIIQFLVGEE